MKKKMLQKFMTLFLSSAIVLSAFGQNVSAQVENGSTSKAPRSAMRIEMNTSVDGQSNINGYEDMDVNITWKETLAIKEPVTISVTEESKLLIDDISDITFLSNGVRSDISDLRIEDGTIKFMTGKASARSNCSLSYKVRTPLAAGDFKISTKVATDNAPNTISNYIQKTFKVTTGLTVETTYDTIYGDLPFDVFGLVNYKTSVQDKDLVLSLDVYNKVTGDMVYELTGDDFPTDNTYRMESLVFPDYVEDGTYVVYVTLADGDDIIGSASKTITYVKSKEFKINVVDIIKDENNNTTENVATSREFIYELGKPIETIQPSVIENATVVSGSINPITVTSLHIDDNYNITGTMPIGNVEITYVYEVNNAPKGYINGLVTNETQVPISNATVKVYESNGIDGDLGTYLKTIITNGNGEFNESLKEGMYNFAISKDGYIPLNVFNINIVADQTYYLEKSLIVIDVPGDGNITGLIYDAYTGNAVSGAAVTLRKGWNNKTGTPVSTGVLSNSSGRYNVVLPYGNYTAEISKNGYITGHINVICALNYATEQNATITPILREDEYRVVLTWGVNPRDLDSHLTGPATSSTRFHIYYPSKNYTQSNGSVASLDVDDTTSYGPETITFKLNPEVTGVYRYSVHDFTNGNSTSSQAMSLSGAQVKVYTGNELKATFNIPTNMSGTIWTVFEVDNGVFKPVNTFSYGNASSVRSMPKK